jgi:hypothetical protein
VMSERSWAEWENSTWGGRGGVSELEAVQGGMGGRRALEWGWVRRACSCGGARNRRQWRVRVAHKALMGWAQPQVAEGPTGARLQGVLG